MIHLRSPEQIAAIGRAGRVVRESLNAAAALIAPGVTTARLNAAVEEVFHNCGATALFAGHPGPTPFPAASCICVNEEVVHGIPGERVLRRGDLVTIDAGCQLEGWCADAAETHPVARVSSGLQRLLDTGRQAHELAIELLPRRELWSQVAAEILALVQDAGFQLLDDHMGHGIGRKLHEPPDLPILRSRRVLPGEDIELRPGMVLAIEPLVGLGSRETRQLDDGWTLVTADGRHSVHFEQTLALEDDGANILTAV